MQPALQAAGHPGASQGNGVYVKPSSSAEIAFYQALLDADSPLLAHVPRFMGTLTPQAPHEALASSTENTDIPTDHSAADGDGEKPKPFIVLSDELASFMEPTILDVKLGSILWDEFASPEKKARLEIVRDSTTTGSLGYRIAGMSVISADGQRLTYDKMYGRKLQKENIAQELVSSFFPSKDRVYGDLVGGIIDLLKDLKRALTETPVELHSSSALIIYEGNRDELEKKLEVLIEKSVRADGTEGGPIGGASESEYDSDESSTESETLKDGTVVVKLIDFAHAKLAKEPYMDVLDGLQNLIKTFEDMDI